MRHGGALLPNYRVAGGPPVVCRYLSLVYDALAPKELQVG